MRHVWRVNPALLLVGGLGVCAAAAQRPPGIDEWNIPEQPASADCVRAKIECDGDDGTESNNSIWHEDGYNGTGYNRAGASAANSFDYAMRFHVPQVCRGETFVYARLVLPVSDGGVVTSTARLRIVGVNQDSPVEFSVARPSLLPKTAAAVVWDRQSDWPVGSGDSDCSPLYRYTGGHLGDCQRDCCAARLGQRSCRQDAGAGHRGLWLSA